MSKENKNPIDMAVDFCISTMQSSGEAFGLSPEELMDALNRKDEKILQDIGERIVKFYYYYGEVKIHEPKDHTAP